MVEIRANEAAKVPLYTDALKKVIKRSKEIGLEKALEEWAEEITKRRMTWFNEHKNSLNLKGTDVEKAFQLVLFEYMKLKPEEVPIIEKTEKKIVWRSYDFCPYLEAVKKLKMDTRVVCRCATHSPVQAMIETINPKLLFSRNYIAIRPYTEYCEEIIELID
ncbi:MAG: hypothetical protein M1334_04660 [Patescibacteria group bacterium]|nr:hypothetical protein [Patescibacteria group bacterium]